MKSVLKLSFIFCFTLLIADLSFAEAAKETDDFRVTLADTHLPPELVNTDLEVDLIFENQASMNEFLTSHGPAETMNVVRQASFFAYLGENSMPQRLPEVLSSFQSGELSRTLCNNVIAVGMYANVYLEIEKEKDPKEKTEEEDDGCPYWWHIECPTEQKCTYLEAPNDIHKHKKVEGKCFRDPTRVWLCVCSIYY